MDVPGILLPGTTRADLAEGMLVIALTVGTPGVASQGGAMERTSEEASMDLGAHVESAKSECGHCSPPRFRRWSL